jgi:branched-subunit amino acid transport protein
MHALEECNNEKEPECRFVEAVSSSSRYRIRVCNQPQRSPFYKIRRLQRYTFHDRVKRSRRLPDYSAFSWSLMLESRRDLRNALLERYAVADENQFKPAYLTGFYYPSCSRFLRTSSSSHHTTLRTGVPSYGPPLTLASGQHTRTSRNNRNSHTRWGVLLEIVVGLFLVGIFFSIIAALTQFQPGQSSTTERGIMMAWLASGLYGFCLPFMSTSELLRVFFLLPLVSVIDLAFTWMDRFLSFHLDEAVYLPSGLEAICSFLPLAIFISPIWGFVLVGRMLVEWGNCIRLILISCNLHDLQAETGG